MSKESEKKWLHYYPIHGNGRRREPWERIHNDNVYIAEEVSTQSGVGQRTQKINLKILTEKKHPKIKLQRLRKIRILTFGSLVHQTNSF